MFKVRDDASKKTIKKNIEKIFKVNVIKVNTITKKSKSKIIRGKIGYKKGYKKALVTLKKAKALIWQPEFKIYGVKNIQTLYKINKNNSFS